MSLVRALPWYTYTSICKNCELEICIESDRTLFLDDPRPWVHRWTKLCEDADPGKEADVILTKDTKHPHWGEEPVTEADVAFVKELKERPYVPSREAFRNRRTALAEASFSLGLDASAEDILERAEQYEKWLNRTMLEGR